MHHLAGPGIVGDIQHAQAVRPGEVQRIAVEQQVEHRSARLPVDLNRVLGRDEAQHLQPVNGVGHVQIIAVCHDAPPRAERAVHTQHGVGPAHRVGDQRALPAADHQQRACRTDGIRRGKLRQRAAQQRRGGVGQVHEVRTVATGGHVGHPAAGRERNIDRAAGHAEHRRRLDLPIRADLQHAQPGLPRSNHHKPARRVDGLPAARHEAQLLRQAIRHRPQHRDALLGKRIDERLVAGHIKDDAVIQIGLAEHARLAVCEANADERRAFRHERRVVPQRDARRNQPADAPQQINALGLHTRQPRGAGGRAAAGNQPRQQQRPE